MTNVLRTATVGDRCYVLVNGGGCKQCAWMRRGRGVFVGCGLVTYEFEHGLPDNNQCVGIGYYIQLPHDNAPEMGRQHAE